jgi:NAD+ kinase
MADRWAALVMIKPQFEVGRGRVGKGGVVRSAEDRRSALVSWRRPRPGSARRCSLRLVGPARAEGQPRDVRVASPRAAARARWPISRPRRWRPILVSRSASVFTHRTPRRPRARSSRSSRRPVGAGFELRFDATETRKHGLTPREGLLLDADPDQATEVCVVLGGDGTILTALRRYAGTDVPVFAVNFGEVGFLATIERGVMEREFARAFAGEFEVLRLPAVVLEGPDGEHVALNDVSIHRKVGERVATLSYAIQGRGGRLRALRRARRRHAGRVDGLQPRQRRAPSSRGASRASSSRSSPRTRSPRARSSSRPNDVLTVHNRSKDVVDVIIDGRPIGELQPEQHINACFRHDVALLAQVPGSTFYRRLRDKFGRLSS